MDLDTVALLDEDKGMGLAPSNGFCRSGNIMPEAVQPSQAAGGEEDFAVDNDEPGSIMESL